MNMLVCLTLAALGAEPARFRPHDIASFAAGYQVAVADVNADGRPDVIALSTAKDTVEWFENPTWQRHPVAHTAKNVDLAPRDIDGDGRPELALAYGFYFSQPERGGELAWLKPTAQAGAPWTIHPIAADPVTHRVRWGDLDGDGRLELVHAPVFGPGSQGAAAPKPAHLWAFRVPADLNAGRWERWRIDESLTVLHGLHVSDLDGDGRDELLTASFEGIVRFDFEGPVSSGAWRKTKISPGAPPVSDKPGAPRGSSEIAPLCLGGDRLWLAAIEPWHGNQVVVYRGQGPAGPYRREVLDDTLREGHALLVADFDGDGQDEIVAGWRGDGGGLVLFDAADASGQTFRKITIDEKVPAEGVALADFNGDGRLDFVVSAGRTNRLIWYENVK